MVPTETSLDFGAYLEQISETYKKLYETRQFSNVTLVSDDHHHIPAHKFILSSSSKMFRKILDNLSEDQVNPLIILKGIKKDNLNAMLQYCYLGHVSLEKSHLKEFLFCMEEKKHLVLKPLPNMCNYTHSTGGLPVLPSDSPRAR